ncbi:gp58-like family protein, partial [Facklamia sp. 253]
MQIKINQRDAPALEFKDGRYYYTFTATEETSSVDIFSDCLGDTQFKKIQIEKSSEMTSFAPPEVYEGNLSGIFKDLKEINLEMKDTESDFWGKIKLNARGMLEEYHNGTLSAEFMKTASGIEQRLRNALSQSENRFTSTADGIRRDLTNVDGRINSVTSTVDGYKQTLISTQAKVDNLKIGGRNLFLKTKDFGGEWFNKGDWTIDAETYQGLVVKKRSGLWQGISQAVPVKVGEVYTFSTYVKTDKTDETIRFYSTHNGTGNPATTDVSTKILPVSDEWQRVNVTFKVTKSGNISPRLERTNEGTIWVAGLKLERGSIATDWTPAPEDLVSGSDFTTYKNEVTETAEGLTRRIEATDGRVNQITETVDGFKREITNSVTGRINTVIETVNGVKREIKSSVDDSLSEMTQNINGFKRLVQDAEKNHSQLAQTVSGLESTVNNNQKNMTSRITQLAGLIDQKVARGDLEGIIRNSGDSIWLAVRDRVTTAAGNSKMSGREIINAINVTTGGTLIRSGDNKLMVTPTTTFIQNGTIKSAMIDTLDASKITTGTLNAANVRVINLDAANITTGNLNTRIVNAIRLNANQITSGSLSSEIVKAIR